MHYMTDSKKVVLIKSGRLERNIRLPKEVETLKKGGYEVTLLSWDMTCESDEPSESDECEIIQLRLKARGIRWPLYCPVWWVFLLYHLLRLKWDVVHTIDIDSVLPAIIAGKTKGAPILYEILDIAKYEALLPRWISNIVTSVDRFLMRLVDGVIVADEMQAVGIGGIPNSKVETIYDSPPKNLQMHSGFAEKKDDAFTLFYVGMFFKSKRLYLDKVAEAVKDLENVILVIAGYGDLEDEVRGWADQTPDKVQFVGRISYSDVFRVGAMSDLMFVLRDPMILANKYTCGSTFLSAMMLGKPILANKGTSTAMKVQEENCGLVIDGSSVAEVKEAIAKLRDNPELRAELAANARTAYEQRYGWHIMEQRLLNLYDKLTGKA